MGEPRDRVEQAAQDAGLSQQDIVKSDIEQTRAELADTVDALSAKLDVKARAGEKVDQAKSKVSEAASKAVQAAPDPVQHALHSAGQKAAPHRGKIAAAVAGAIVVLMVVRRFRRES